MEVWHCFFFNDTATTEIYTLSLHDALPIYAPILSEVILTLGCVPLTGYGTPSTDELTKEMEPFVKVHNALLMRSEEHTSELQSRQYLVCRLLLEKKKLDTLVARSVLCSASD